MSESFLNFEKLIGVNLSVYSLIDLLNSSEVRPHCVIGTSAGLVSPATHWLVLVVEKQVKDEAHDER